VVEPVLTRIEPIFSPRPWGAHSLAPLFHDKTNLTEPLGEAWLTAYQSRVANGPFAGKSLGEAWHNMPAEWRGTHAQQFREFPLLVKFLFPNDKLSIQVHPDDEYAAQFEQAAGGRGKTEMWHIVHARPGAALLLGLQPGVTKDDFVAGLKNRCVEELLLRYPVHEGETYFVAAGTPHAILPGMIVCEVQEYSDLTYRVYDYGRLDAQGKPRELHIDKALEVTRFEGTRAGKLPPLSLHSPDANKRLLAACEFFATERWDCDRTTNIEADPTEFQLLVILAGGGRLHDAASAHTYQAGQAWFVPASLELTLLQPNEPTSLLRVVVPDAKTLVAQLHKQGFEEQDISHVVIG
jgi:mannose-6-phosphate isomerase